MSLKRIPGFGKSGTSRMAERTRAAMVSMEWVMIRCEKTPQRPVAVLTYPECECCAPPIHRNPVRRRLSHLSCKELEGPLTSATLHGPHVAGHFHLLFFVWFRPHDALA